MPTSTLTGRFGFRVGVRKACPDPVTKTPTINSYDLTHVTFDYQGKRVHAIHRAEEHWKIIARAVRAVPIPPGRPKRTVFVGGTLLLVRKDAHLIRKYTNKDTHRTLRPPSLSLRSPDFDRWFDDDAWQLQDVPEGPETTPWSSSQYDWHPMEKQLVLKKCKELKGNRPATVRYFQQDPLFAKNALGTF
ncbi:hypothetical protein CYMTET_45505 [Cymbomonas tetramitiformis]|uniref:Uncharacterized protein n=1 Tax=Cymbomonas tetramitiformis TaxID=36881 RepID=A0AAE0BZ89_9CHLO|nr:hypothetical protein CYMTET_45505 [Cymbomonas tetramitiformis]|eukprot:gene974-1490_t